MRYIAGVMTGFLLSTSLAWATHPSPPLIEDKKIYLYLKKIHNELHKLEVTTTNPNGSRRGRLGETIWWNDGGTYRLRVNTDTGQGGTTWVANS